MCSGLTSTDTPDIRRISADSCVLDKQEKTENYSENQHRGLTAPLYSGKKVIIIRSLHVKVRCGVCIGGVCHVLTRRASWTLREESLTARSRDLDSL